MSDNTIRPDEIDKNITPIFEHPDITEEENVDDHEDRLPDGPSPDGKQSLDKVEKWLEKIFYAWLPVIIKTIDKCRDDIFIKLRNRLGYKANLEDDDPRRTLIKYMFDVKDQFSHKTNTYCQFLVSLCNVVDGKKPFPLPTSTKLTPAKRDGLKSKVNKIMKTLTFYLKQPVKESKKLGWKPNRI